MKRTLKTLSLLLLMASSTLYAQVAPELTITDTKAKELKGITKIYLERFRVVYNIKDFASATSSAFGSNEQAGVRAAATLGVTKETLQELTDAAFAMFKEKVKTNGFEFVENTEIQNLDIYKDNTKAHEPITLPANFDKEDKICVYSTPTGFVTLGNVGPMKKVKAFAKQGDIITANINLTAAFVNFEAKGSKIGVKAKVKTNAELAVGRGIPCQAGFMDDGFYSIANFSCLKKYGYGVMFGHKDHFAYPEDIGTFEVANSGNTSMYLGSYGVSSTYKGYIYKVEQEAYKKAMLSLIEKEFDNYFLALKEKAK